ncbi:hypothetical protein Hdeb2414_s0719g00939281 [Helianthus debilis subsp. tardiflorus]
MCQIRRAFFIPNTISMAFPSQSLILHPASQSVDNNGSGTKEARTSR